MNPETALKRYVKKRVKMIIDDTLKEYRRIARTTFTPMAKEIQSDISDAYSKSISGFYSYIPVYYLRHDMTRRLPLGKNLYRSYHSTMVYNNRYVKSILIDINAEDMKGENYGVSKDYVLSNITEGFRSPYVKSETYDNEWRIGNVSIYGTSLRGLTLNEAFLTGNKIQKAINGHIRKTLPQRIRRELVKSGHPVIQKVLGRKRR